MLNELFVQKFNQELKEDEYIIFVGKNTIYFIPNENSEEAEALCKQIVDKEEYTEVDEDDIEVDFFKRDINDYYPQAIAFGWEPGSDTLMYFVPNLNHNPDVRIFKHLIDALKQLKKELNVKYLETTEYVLYYKGDEEHEHEETYHIDDLIENFEKNKERKLPNVVYHGTATKHLREILKTGVVGYLKSDAPKPNFGELIKHNKLFLTSNKLDAFFYANNAAEVTKTYPIILEIKTDGIDTDKIGFDYDFYIDYIGQGDEDFDRIKPVKKEKKFTMKHLQNKYIGASLRKFSYDGRIMPKWIINIYYNESSDEEDFSNSVDINEFEDFLNLVEWTEEMYGYQNDEYYLDMDAYKDYLAEEDENNNEKMENIEMHKLNESPDHVCTRNNDGDRIIYRYNDRDAYAFAYYEGQLYAIEGRQMHSGLADKLANESGDRCEYCDGDGYNDCEECGGSGHLNCPTCEGDGRVDCSDCNGSGNKDCPDCEGTGTVGEDDCENCGGGGSVDCENCDGRGSVDCEDCNGDDVEYCQNCEGNGRIKCEECGGYGGSGSGSGSYVGKALYNKGRIWLNAKLISFYGGHYPEKNDLYRIILDLEKVLSEYIGEEIKIWKNGFRVEIFKSTHPDFEKYIDYPIEDSYEKNKLIPVELYNYGKREDTIKRRKKPWWYRQMLYGENYVPKLSDFKSEAVSPNRLEVYFDNIQDIMKQKLQQEPFNIPPEEVEKYLDQAITQTVINQLKIREFVVTEYERGSSEEQVADMILSQQKEGLGKNDIFKKKNVNDKNGIYTDQDVPNTLMGEMVDFKKFWNKRK